MGLKNCIYTSRIGKCSSFWISVPFLTPPAGVGRSNARNHPYLGYAVSASPREPPPGSLSRLISEYAPLSQSSRDLTGI